ncbi:MAG: hypothetical protein ACRC6V_00215, partial [Bacteroidales bacterium]
SEGIVHYSPSFSVKINIPVVPTPPAPPLVTDLFDAENSYINSSSMNVGDSIIISELQQITMDKSTFFAVTEYDATGSGATYQIFDTANSVHSFTLTQTSSSAAGGGCTYRYFGIPTFKYADAAKYILRATKGGTKVQDSKPFTIVFTNLGNLIP